MLADLGWFCLPTGAQKVVDSPGANDDDQRHRSAARLFLERLSISRKCVPTRNLTPEAIGLPKRVGVPEWSRNAGRLASQRRSVGNARLFGCPGSRLDSGCVLGNRAFNQSNCCPAMPPEMAVVCCGVASAEDGMDGSDAMAPSDLSRQLLNSPSAISQGVKGRSANSSSTNLT